MVYVKLSLINVKFKLLHLAPFQLKKRDNAEWASLDFGDNIVLLCVTLAHLLRAPKNY